MSLKSSRQPAVGKDKKPLPVVWRDPKDGQSSSSGGKERGEEDEDVRKEKKKGEANEDDDKESEDEESSDEEDEGSAKKSLASSPYRKLTGLDSRITLVLAFSKVRSTSLPLKYHFSA